MVGHEEGFVHSSFLEIFNLPPLGGLPTAASSFFFTLSPPLFASVVKGLGSGRVLFLPLLHQSFFLFSL